MTAPTVVSITLSEAEHRLLRNALRSFIADFGHDETDVRTGAQLLLAKLSPAQAE